MSNNVLLEPTVLRNIQLVHGIGLRYIHRPGITLNSGSLCWLVAYFGMDNRGEENTRLFRGSLRDTDNFLFSEPPSQVVDFEHGSSYRLYLQSDPTDRSTRKLDQAGRLLW